jgi:hypothetical protein
VVVADQRTAVDFARVVKHLVDVHYPDAERIVLVMDNWPATRRARCTRHSHQPKLGAWRTSWKVTSSYGFEAA